MLEAAIGLLLQFVLEVAGQLLFELAVMLGWESLKQGIRRDRYVNPALATLGQVLIGAAAGGLSVWLVPVRMIEATLFPGVSVIVSPVVTGLIMDELGDRWIVQGKEAPALFNFRAGASFAFGMAVVRFLYFWFQPV